ncbi:hypothetical protein ACF0H5_023920 [Mactra antiquata]
MAIGEQEQQNEQPKPETGFEVPVCHVTITDDVTSTAGECGTSRQSTDETGHERLLRKTASNDGKTIPHCRASRPPHYLYFAILVTFFCNFPFGLAAIVFSVLSKRKGLSGNVKDAKFYGSVSKWLCAIGLAVTAVVVAFTIVYFDQIDKNIVDTQEELRSGT